MRIRLLFIITCLSWMGCSGPAPGTDSEEITMATLKGPSAIGMIGLMEEADRDSSLKIRVIIKDEPLQVRAMMLQEEVDFAILPSTMGALMYNKGIDYLLAAIPVWGTLYLVGNDPAIRGWEDLKGRHVHLMGRGMTPDILFRYLAEMNGLKPDMDIFLDYSFPTHLELANALSAGRAAIGVISEPLVSLIMERNSKMAPLIDLNDTWNQVHKDTLRLAQTALLIRKEFANEQPDIVADILTRYKRSTDWVNQHPDDAGKLVAAYKILPDAALASRSIPRSHLDFEEAWPIRNEVMSYFEVFLEYDPLIIGGKLPDETFFYKK